jgi:hypothetical protein
LITSQAISRFAWGLALAARASGRTTFSISASRFTGSSTIGRMPRESRPASILVGRKLSNEKSVSMRYMS